METWNAKGAIVEDNYNNRWLTCHAIFHSSKLNRINHSVVFEESLLMLIVNQIHYCMLMTSLCSYAAASRRPIAVSVVIT